MRINPSSKWRKEARKAYETRADKPVYPATSAGPNVTFLLGLYRQGYTAKQAGKLMAALANCDRAGDKLKAFDWFNVGFLECAPYV